MVIISTPAGDLLICYSCFQNRKDTENEKLLYWLPEDKENYPATCERCGFVHMGDTEWPLK